MTCPFELFPFLFQVRASQEFPGSLWYTAVVSGQSATNGWQLLHCAHHYKSRCIENYWCDYQGCYSCASINKYSTSKRHSRINSKGTALCETKIASCHALKVPSAGCHVPAVTSQGPCLPLKCKKHMWLQKPWGYSLSLQDSDTEKLEPTYKYTFEYQCSTSGSQNLPTFSELRRSQANSNRMGFSLSASLAAMGSLQQLPLTGPHLGILSCSVSPEEVYRWSKWSKTHKRPISLRSRSMTERLGLNQVAYFTWLYLYYLYEKVCGCLGRSGERRMPLIQNAYILLQWVAWVRARC